MQNEFNEQEYRRKLIEGGLSEADATDLAARPRALLDAGDILLVKGSKGVKVSLIVDALRKLGQSAPGLSAGTNMGEA